jgi:hypothetical protein
MSEEKQFDKFWMIKCPKCGEPIDLEVLINSFRERAASKK